MKTIYYIYDYITLEIEEEFALAIKLDVEKVVKKIRKEIPTVHFSSELNSIQVKSYQEFDDPDDIKMYQSFYEPLDKVIYIIKENLKTNDELYKFIVHEIAHVCWVKFFFETVESDFKIFEKDDIIKDFINEFRFKRLKLADILLNKKAIRTSEMWRFREKMANILYDPYVEYLLFSVIGEENLAKVCDDIIFNVYGLKDISEYFCVLYEHYYVGSKRDKKTVNKTSKIFEELLEAIKYSVFT